MAPFGHAWTHAGASPPARRPRPMSHLRTIPRLRCVEWDQVAVVARLDGRCLGVVALRDPLNGGEVGLKLEVPVDRCLVDGVDGREDRHGNPTTTRPSTARTGNVATATDGSS